MFTVYKEFHFDSAHYLPLTPESNKCHHLHGHTFHLKVSVSADDVDELGWIVDFGDIKTVVNPVLKMLDHKCLNDIEGLENPTCENVARWIYKKLKVQLSGLSSIHVKETVSSGCIYSED